MFLIYRFPHLLDSRRENLHTSFIVFQLIKIKIAEIELFFQDSPYMLKRIQIGIGIEIVAF